MFYRLGSCLLPLVSHCHPWFRKMLCSQAFLSTLRAINTSPNPYSYSTSTLSHYHTSIQGFSLPDCTVRISLISFASSSAPSYPEDSPILTDRLPHQHPFKAIGYYGSHKAYRLTFISLIVLIGRTPHGHFAKVSLDGFPNIRLWTDPLPYPPNAHADNHLSLIGETACMGRRGEIATLYQLWPTPCSDWMMDVLMI